MVPLELHRAGLLPGRVVIDDTGVTRHGPLASTTLPWSGIRDYRLTIEIRGAQPELLYLVKWVGPLLIARDLRHGYRGDHRLRFGIELFGDTERLALDRRFRGAAVAIGQILRRIHPALASQARAAFAAHGLGQFGPLAISAHGVRWADKLPLPRAAVESIELFNSSPVRLRVMARRKAWPYGQAELADIPNLGAALELAAALGYPVRGHALCAPLLG